MRAPASGVLPGELVARADAWIGEDPDPGTRAELTALLEKGDEVGLRDRFDRPLSFGTAGLRGPIGAGPGRMNRVVVRKTTAGLAQYLLDHQGHPAPSVVVGHDARHRSADFADDAARVAAASGVRVWRFEDALPTPITAFAVRQLRAAAGVMITASHNPAPDNGYKVYLGDGAQIIPPADGQIAEAAASAVVPGEAALSGPFDDVLADIDGPELLAAYRGAVLPVAGTAGPRRLRIIYSPLHGVGAAVLPRLLEDAGFEPPALVAVQAIPDPDFPTAPFPNPEEPGVLDPALADAERLRADLVLVNDPDADRLAVAVPDRSGAGFTVLSGDELGVLIADHLMATTAGADRLVATTVVSSSMLSALAARAGVAYVETLTGFKWIARAAQLRPGHRLLFGYEEALGYAVSDAVADKDGLSAALVVADMAARAKHDGRSLLDRFEELESRAGRAFHRPVVVAPGGHRRPSADDVAHGPVESRASAAPGRARSDRSAGPGQGRGRLATLRRPDHPPGGRRPGGAAAERDRAQAQGLLRGDDRPQYARRPGGGAPGGAGPPRGVAQRGGHVTDAVAPVAAAE